MRIGQEDMITESIHSQPLKPGSSQMGGERSDHLNSFSPLEIVDQTTILVEALEEKLELDDTQKLEMKKGLGQLLSPSDSSPSTPMKGCFWDQLLKESFGREQQDQSVQGSEQYLELLKRATVLHLMYRILTIEQRLEFVDNLV